MAGATRRGPSRRPRPTSRRVPWPRESRVGGERAARVGTTAEAAMVWATWEAC